MFKKNNKMDKYQTIHVVSEIAVLTLMYIHFDKKIKTLEAELEHVKKTYVNTFDDVYQKMEVLKQGILQSSNQQQSPQPSKPKVFETMKQVNFDNFTIFDVKSVPSKKQEDSPKIQILDEEQVLREEKATEKNNQKEVVAPTPPKSEILEPIAEETEEITETEITEIESLIEKGKTD